MTREPVELMHRSRVDRRLAIMLGVVLPLTLFLLGVATLAMLVATGSEELTREKPWLEPATWVVAPIVMVFAGILWYMMRILRRARLIIDDAGMSLDLRGAPRWMLLFIRPWSVRWSEITAARWWAYGQRPAPHGVWLQLARRHGRTVHVTPLQWVPMDTGPDIPSLVRRPPSPAAIRSLLADSTIVRAVRHYRPDLNLLDDEEAFLDQVSPALGMRGVTPTTGVIATLSGLSVAYMVVDVYFLADEFYAGARPWAAIAGLGLLAAGIALLALKRLEPDRRDTLAYAALLGLVVGIGAYPGLLRVNAWLSPPATMHTVEYRLGEDHRWHPVDASQAPVLGLYTEYSDWWRRFEPGDRYRFRVRNGTLGFWQVDMAPVYAEQREFYQGR